MEIQKTEPSVSRKGLGLHHSHSVQFYQQEEFLADAVGKFLAKGVNEGRACVAFLRPSRIDVLKQNLALQGIAQNSSLYRERLLLFDAEETLSQFMVDGMPDPNRFQDLLGGILRPLEQKYGQTQAYGEMVDVLWARGNVEGTLRLEEEWNRLAENHSFSLLCGYSIRSFSEERHAQNLLQICSTHTTTLPAEDFSPISEDQQRRAIALLQHKAQVLERQLIDRQAVEKVLRDRERELKLAQEDLKRSVCELARSNSELARFAYVASHDLKEPLRMVNTYMQLLAKNYAAHLDERAKEYIGFAVDGAMRMHALIDDLLNYASLGSQRAEPEAIDANELVSDVKANLKSAISETNASILCDPLPKVLGDRPQLVQLFQNLLSNSMKFRGDRKPVIKIAARPAADGHEFSVGDNGIGIPPEHFDRIFLLFQRLHDRHSYPGTGLGLAICKKIVETHRGKIWLESRLGEGTTFHFSLPSA